MKPRIRVLDDALVDQIAAGEVVERPASIVKELLENAMDAGARSVTIEIEGGGTESIRVADDGHGMTAEEAPLAVRRHATSKIATREDLVAIRTLGFRGEALPSMASVSKFALTSRTRDALGATRVRVSGGSGHEVRETGGAPGTTVEVRDLFYNVPARRKFLKSQATENAHITDVCVRAALADPGLKLVLYRSKRRAREFLPVGSLGERARGVFPGERLVELRGSRDGIELTALLGAPEKARSGASALHLFVNGRPVRDRALARAVAFAYGSVLPPGRYPTGVVHIVLPGEEVDVNVHPQKAEVRFARGRAVLDQITRILSSKLGTSAWGGPEERGPEYWGRRLGSSKIEGAETGPSPAADPWGIGGALRESTASYTFGEAPSSASSDGAEPQQALSEEAGFFGRLRVLAQVRRMLIVTEGRDGLLIIDQHAADERVRFHDLRGSYQAKEVATQRLLFPERVEVSESEATLLEERRAELAKMGMDCALVGPSTVAIHAVPSLVSRAAPERLLRDVLDELTRQGDRAFGDAIDTALATMACHGAIRAGDPMSPGECVALLNALDRVGDFKGHCPHGRPVAHTVSFGEIERKLGR